MKPIFFFSLLLLSLVCHSSSEAQVSTSAHSKAPISIFEALSAEREGEGIITIYQPASVKAAVGKVSGRLAGLIEGESNIRLIQGYRIQVYNGNMAVSKREANRRAAQITQLHPEMHCYLTYRAPFWRLLVGDFSSREEAEEAKQQLKKSFPSYAREIYVVRDKIRQGY